LVVDAETMEILHVYKADGTEHDFTMLKNSILDEFGENVKILVAVVIKASKTITKTLNTLSKSPGDAI